MDDDLKNEDLANTSQVMKKTDTFDATESEYESSESSPEDDEVPEESSVDPIGEVFVQVSVTEEKSIAECNDNINNKDGINSEKASLLVGTEPDAGRENISLQKHDRAPTYIDPRECSGPERNTYGKNNNKFKKYKAKKRKSRCYICGDSDHEGKLCKKVTDCFICSRKGHLAIYCPKKNVKVDLTSRLCLKCGSTGHDMFSCTNNYDSEDLKAIKCYICKKVGHLCCVDDKTKGQTEASCYKCGQSGHFGSECTKPNEVAVNPGAFCNKCKTRGHYERQCPKKAQARTAAEKAARTAKRKARRARRLENTNPTPIVDSYQNQPNGLWRAPFVGPYYGQSGSNVSFPPAATTSLNHQAGPLPLPSHQQHINYNSSYALTQFPHHLYPNSHNKPQIPQIPFNQEPQIMVPQTGSEMIRQPVSQLPVPTREFQRGSQIFRPHVNHQTGVVLPQTESRVPLNSTVLPSQFPCVIQNNPRQPLSHQTATGTHIPQQSLTHETRQPVTQLPVPTWEFQRGSQVFRPHVNHQTGVVLPQTESRVPLNSTVLPSQLPCVIQNNPRQPLSHQTATGTHIHQQSLTHETRQHVTQLPVPTWEFQRGSQIFRPHVNHQTGAVIPQTESRVPLNSTVLPSQFPHVIQNNPRQPLSHHTATGTHIPQQSLTHETRQHVTQLPVPTWEFQRGSQIFRPHVNHQTGVVLPQTDSRVPLNSTVLPSQFPHVIHHNPRQPLSHQTATGTNISQQSLTHETRVMPPHHI